MYLRACKTATKEIQLASTTARSPESDPSDLEDQVISDDAQKSHARRYDQQKG